MTTAKSTVGPGRKRPKTGGRVKGTPNKVTKDLKEMILGALSAAGGEKYLQAQATASPSAFLALIGKVLPMQIAGDATAPLVVQVLTVTQAQEQSKAWQKAS